MNSHEAFLKGLETIRRTADAAGGSISVADILNAFPDVELEEGQIALIYDYLDRENIRLKDYVPHDTRSLDLGEEDEAQLTEEEQKIFDYYLEDLAGIRPLSSEETQALAKDLAGGAKNRREAAYRRLVEGNLHYVIRLAGDFAGKGVALTELIQEGNLCLMEALQEYRGEDGDLEDHLEKAVKKGLRALIREETAFGRLQEEMARDANRILEELKEAEAEEDRALSAAEISQRLGIPVSRVDEVLRESARAIRNAEK